MSVLKLNNYIIFTLIALESHSGVVSGIDQSFKLSRITQKKTISAKSSGIKSYQRILSRTLGSHCKMYPHDSKFAQINAQKCSHFRGMFQSMSRFYLENDAPVLNGDILIKKEVKYVDLPTNCDLY
jgi:putative component of membrane protein insertase Oxa1/YidC/SpoIIIJ protein YidD